MTELKLDIADRIATLTIDRPERRNAMSYEMWAALPGLMTKVAESGARAFILRGTEHFSAGADISEFRTFRKGLEGTKRYQAVVFAGERAIALSPVPTIAAISGFCIGGGCELAVACDMRIAAHNVRIGITAAKLGLVYSFTSTKQLVATVGPAWAKQILFAGDLYDAETAARIGLVNEIAEDPYQRAAELADTIAHRAGVTVRGAKNIIDRIIGGQDEEDDEVRQLYQEGATSEDYAEGVAAFLEKRDANFWPKVPN